MKTQVILERLILDPKTFFTDLNFQFINSLNLIHGNFGSGKTTLLKIIKLLTDNKENIDFDFFKHIFRNQKEIDKSFIFKYELNLEFLNYDHSVIICIHIADENIELTSQPPYSSHEIEQITQKLNIQYLNLDEIDSFIYSTNREDLSYLSIGERIWKVFLEMTRKLENDLILVDDIQSELDVAHRFQFFQYLSDLSKQNQIIISSTNSTDFDYLKDLRGTSVFRLKNPWQKNIHDYFKEDPKSDYYREFQLSIKNIKKTLELKLNIDEKRLKDFLIRILYANIITAMETYLSDCFIDKVINNKNYIPKLLELIPEFNEKKVNLKKAYDWIENLNDNIIDVLSGISFHNLAKAKFMYENILNIEFPQDLGDIFRAILNRHDIVHRNGKTKDNEEILISKQDLNDLIVIISEFIKNIELQAREI